MVTVNNSIGHKNNIKYFVLTICIEWHCEILDTTDQVTNIGDRSNLVQGFQAWHFLEYNSLGFR